MQRDKGEAENERDRASVCAHTAPQVRAITKDRHMQKEAKDDAFYFLSITWYTLSHCLDPQATGGVFYQLVPMTG